MTNIRHQDQRNSSWWTPRVRVRLSRFITQHGRFAAVSGRIRRATKAPLLGSAALMIMGCSQNMEPGLIFTIPLKEWQSHPAIPAETFKASETEFSILPRTDGIFKSSYFSNPKRAGVYFYIDRDTYELIDPKRIASKHNPVTVEMEFSLPLTQVLAVHEMVRDGLIDDTGGTAAQSRDSARNWRGNGTAFNRQFFYRCEDTAAGLKFVANVYCRAIMKGEIAGSIVIGFSISRDDAKEDGTATEAITKLVAETVLIESSFKARAAS